MNGKTFLGAIILTCVAVGAGAAEAPPPPRPDMDLLEYLGTFETARGKGVDPMELKDVPLTGKTPQHPARDRKSKEKKKNTEKQPGKEAGDE